MMSSNVLCYGLFLQVVFLSIVDATLTFGRYEVHQLEDGTDPADFIAMQFQVSPDFDDKYKRNPSTDPLTFRLKLIQ